MEKIIYAKMSNDREEKFRIQTLIIEDGKNRKIVKKPDSAEAAVHVASLEKYSRQLSEQYKGSGMEVNRCYMEKESAVFEYIAGNSLEYIADEFLVQGESEQAAKLLLTVAEKLHSVDCVPFEPDDRFEEVFGSVDTMAIEGKPCGAVADVDLILSNILVRDGQWVIVDYEWTFDFRIPTSFIVYRMLHYYVETTALRQQLDFLELCENAGISELEILCFEQMEEAFQAYIDGRHVPLRKLYGMMGKPAIDAMECCRREVLAMQVYFDDGSGSSEGNSYRIPSVQSKAKFNLAVEIPENVKTVRIDPMDEAGIVILHTLRFKHETKTADYISNGKALSDQVILFGKEDPMFIIPCEGQRELIVHMWVEKLGKDTLEALDEIATLKALEALSDQEKEKGSFFKRW